MTGVGEVCMANIGAHGIARRRRRGWAWVAGALVASLGLIVGGAAPPWHLLLVIVYGRGLLGLLQAREKT